MLFYTYSCQKSVNSFERRLESCAGPYHKRILSEYCVEEKNTFHSFNLTGPRFMLKKTAFQKQTINKVEKCHEYNNKPKGLEMIKTGNQIKTDYRGFSQNQSILEKFRNLTEVKTLFKDFILSSPISLCSFLSYKILRSVLFTLLAERECNL